MPYRKLTALLIGTCLYTITFTQSTDANLHASKPEYAIPYIVPSQNDIVKTLDKVYNYINANTTAAFINKKTKEVVNPAQVDTNTVFQKEIGRAHV